MQDQSAASTEQLRIVFGDAPVALTLVDPMGTLVQANRCFLELIGREECEVVGQHVSKLTAPEDLDSLERWAIDAARSDFECIAAHEGRLLHLDGRRIWVRTEVSVIRAEDGSVSYLAGHVADISARKAAEMALSTSEERFRALADALPDPVIRFDLEARPIVGNRAARRLFGDERRREMEQPDRDLDRSLKALGAACVATGEVQSIEHDLLVGESLRYFRTRMLAERGCDGRIESVLMMSTDLTERRAAEMELAFRATTDPLTGLANRAAFHAALTSRLEAAGEGPAAVLFCDLDRFKVVNDSLGHGCGDDLLVAVARRIVEHVPDADVVARLGGDEFTLLLGSTDDSSATRVAANLCSALELPFDMAGQQLRVTASVGVAMAHHGDIADDVMRRADAAMYRAKDRGRARVALFDDDLATHVQRRLDLDQQLRRALELDELRVAYQPEVDLATGEVLGAEALVRWEHDGRLHPAGEFIEAAEENGLILPIGEWVLRQATAQAAEWVERFPGNEFVLRVNLSARQFDHPGLADLVSEQLARSGLSPFRLCLEITETALMANADAAQRTLEQLHGLGVSLAVDDFGTGYSSLAYLKRFPVDVLKIDRTFVDGLPNDPDDVAIVATIIRLAETLEMTVTAEGVETAEQGASLLRLGCRRAQGFYFAFPGPPEVFAQLLERRLPSAL